MKTSKIKSVDEVKTWGDGQRKTYYHNLTMENGDKINIGKKKEQQVGWELTYEITDTSQEWNKAKAVNPNQATTTPLSGKNNDQIGRLACIKASAEFYAQSTASVSKVIATAEMFFKYSQNGEMPNPDKIDVE
jgi:hypothetical protein